MEELRYVSAVLIGIAARLAFPILFTMLVVLFLRRLDAHWQKQAQQPPAKVVKPACWEIKGCAPEQSKSCVGRTSPLPCWQAQRTANGYLREACLGCAVFTKAPAPGHSLAIETH